MTTDTSQPPPSQARTERLPLQHLREHRRTTRKSRRLLTAGWVVILAAIAFFFWQIGRAGLDIRSATAVFWAEHRSLAELNNSQAMASLALENAHKYQNANASLTLEHPGPGMFDHPRSRDIVLERWRGLRPLYAHMLQGSVDAFDTQAMHPATATDLLDQPPLRVALFTLLYWRSRTHIAHFQPRKPGSDVIDKVFGLNTLADAVAAIAVFLLVWIWVQRRAIVPAPNRLSKWMRWPWGQTRQLNADDIAAITATPTTAAFADDQHWSQRWGDPYLLAPLIALGICMLLSLVLSFTPEVSQGVLRPPIDQRIASIGWWIFLVLRFAAAVALARFLPAPFRAPVCAMIAATLLWLNPATILGDHAWPQTDVWMLPFFAVAALLVTLDWWLLAGVVLGVGCLFKSELLLVAPVLVLCPLFAGWPGRFLRILAGFAGAMAVCLWPFLVTNSIAAHYVLSAAAGAGIVCLLTILHPIIRRSRLASTPVEAPEIPRNGNGDSLPPSRREPLDAPIPLEPDEDELQAAEKDAILSDRNAEVAAPVPVNRADTVDAAVLPRRSRFQQATIYLSHAAIPVAMLATAALLLWICGGHSRALWISALALCAAVLGIPWMLPRRLFPAWILLILAAAIWLAGFHLDGKFSWWNVGFAYALPSSQSIQPRGGGMANVMAIMQSQFQWKASDPLSTWHLPLRQSPLVLNAGQSLALLYLAALLLCAVAAAIQLRRRDNRFLIALIAPWILAATLWTPLSAQFMLVPAALTAILVGVSVGMSFLQFVLTILSCTMIANLVLAGRENIALSPVTWSILHPANPDIAWTMPLLAATALFCALSPRWRADATSREA